MKNSSAKNSGSKNGGSKNSSSKGGSKSASKGSSSSSGSKFNNGGTSNSKQQYMADAPVEGEAFDQHYDTIDPTYKNKGANMENNNQFENESGSENTNNSQGGNQNMAESPVASATRYVAKRIFGLDPFSNELADHPLMKFIKPEDMKNFADKFATEAENFIRENPVKAISGAVVAGFLLGLSNKKTGGAGYPAKH